MKKPLVIAAAVAAAVLTGHTIEQAEPDTPAPTPKPEATEQEQRENGIRPELVMLDELGVVPEQPMSGYDSEEAHEWADHGDGCDTRAVLLERESAVPVEKNSNCTVLTGLWEPVAYSEETETEASAVDIDHVVPLAEAWRSGADSWSDEQWESFTNDLDEGGNLVIADKGIQRDKGDQDPTTWLPAQEQCEYADHWVRIKHKFSLTVDEHENTVLRGMLSSCPVY